MRRIMILMVGCLWITGCTSSYTQPIDTALVSHTVEQDESVIVFFRATMFGCAVSAPVLEVMEDGQLKFIATVHYGTKIQHQTTPGRHIYLIDGEFGYFMDANIEGGKTYYAYIDPRVGWWGARMTFNPVTDRDIESDTFKEDFAKCDWHVSDARGEQWFLHEKDRLKQRYIGLILSNAARGWPTAAKMLSKYGVSVPIK